MTFLLKSIREVDTLELEKDGVSYCLIRIKNTRLGTVTYMDSLNGNPISYDEFNFILRSITFKEGVK